MICPNCRQENENGARFCMRCGAPMPQEPSRVRKFFSSLLHALLYYVIFFCIQAATLFIYEFVLMLGAAGGLTMDFYNGGDFDAMYDKLLQTVTDQLTQNLHIVLILSALLTVLVYCIGFHLRHKSPVQEMHVHAVSPARLFFCLLLGASMQAVATITIALLPIPESVIESFNANSEWMYGGPLTIEFLNVAIFTPIIEELTFRGLVFTRLRRGMSVGVAVFVSALIFGAAHGHILSFAYAGVLGILLACLMLRNRDSVLAPICCHAGFNAASYLIQLLPNNLPIILSVYCAALALGVAAAYLAMRKQDVIESI